MTPAAVIKEAWQDAISELASHGETCDACESQSERCPEGRRLYDEEQRIYAAYRTAREAQALAGGTI